VLSCKRNIRLADDLACTILFVLQGTCGCMSWEELVQNQDWQKGRLR
jgi:hypothetical protein